MVLKKWEVLYGDYIGIAHLAIRNSAFMRSIKKDLLSILLSLMFLAKNMLKIFKTINRNNIKSST